MAENNKIEIIEDENLKSEDFYVKFKETLDKEHSFPGNYIFKFIVLTESKKIAMLHKIFDYASATFTTKESAKGKYTSVSINVYVPDSESVIGYYKEVSEIEGIIML